MFMEFKGAGLIDHSKDRLRVEARDRRARAARMRGAEAARDVARRFMHEISPARGQTVALYWPFGDELDTGPLIDMLAASGAALALPVVVGSGAPLTFRYWRAGQPLVRGAYDIKIPLESAGTVRPDVIGVPLLAFDEAGHRLGYGGGFYDRTLETLRGDGGPRPLAVGLAFEQQRVAWLPRHGGDQALDLVITDHAVHRIGSVEIG